MLSKPTTLPLAELLELIIDHRGKTPNKLGFDDFFSTGVPVLSAKHVKTDVLVDVGSMRYASPEMYKKWMTVEVQEGDIILTSEAPMGEVFYINDDQKYVLGQRVFGLRPNPSRVNPRYLAAWLASSEGQNQIAARASGSTVQGIRQSELLKLEVDLPSEEEQERIANVRFSVADKVNLNLRINQTLEAIAQVLFKSWFVDFDPVKAKIAAKAEGRDPLRAAISVISGKPDAELDTLPPEQYEQFAATAALFPADMDESEFGEIPRSWAFGVLGDICSFTAGSAFKPEYQGSSDGDYPFIKVSDMNLAGNEVFIQSANNYVSKYQQSEMKAKLHPPGATVFAKIGVALTSNRRRLLTTPTIIDNNLMSANPVDEKSGQYFLYLMLNAIDFNTLVSGTALPYINVSDLKKISIVCPLHEVVLAFEAKVSSIFAMMQTLAAQSSTLAATRNILLPKLLSGEVEVSGILGS
ncbi:TPA: restriction endonuclease subunit S [Pseudomonas aeruginosa]|uniref:restriction endonuclease subunit S n=1 Tax=Pseudomonas aeruginosa TaxID=287 RepID=UPI0009A4CB7C|nr:restriction endonuclease subunit S [Pseudomonas aeruginosa]MBG6272715.1 restriction endonuclease subunit S [Pseudomonas aeruginosa]MCO7651029.1 restriction endonuclease subunit S [Pseudomonas aeruginosa]HBO4952028.1 restriction endonuclease subunit S [Pseudomonas aeruginosa]HCF3392384.1 restriction endonuclease subunit S [Pseudomonas aeruginosa]HCU2066024.1 restriction endonuclease subunit S [Pseudomonas aeruginosa]